MNFKITLMELKRLKKTIIIALLVPAAYTALIMVFFIAFSDVIGEMSYLFDNASLKGLLKAFSMDVDTFSYILNFYTAYSGMYVLIMGIIFASILGVHLFSEELTKGTYEFIYSTPISRTKMFVSKAAVVLIYLIMMNVLIFFIGFTSMEVLKNKSPLMPWLTQENQALLMHKTEASPEKLMAVFDLNESLFYSVIYYDIKNEIKTMPSEDKIDNETVNDMMALFVMNPDAIFDEILNDIDRYMVLYNIGIGDKENFIEIIEKEKAYYFNLKENFSKDKEVVMALFRKNPKLFLDQLIELDKTETFKKTFNFTDKEFDRLFIRYSFENYLALTLVSFLIMWSLAMFNLMLTVVMPKGKFSVGMAMGVSMLFYMLNIIGNISDQVAVIKYMTPLSYLNTDVTNVAYQTETYALVTMALIIVLSLSIGLRVYRNSDFIA